MGAGLSVADCHVRQVTSKARRPSTRWSRRLRVPASARSLCTHSRRTTGRRPGAEVAALMRLLRRYLMTETGRCIEQSIRINIIGRRDRLSAGPGACRSSEVSGSLRLHRDAAADRRRLLGPVQHSRGGAPCRFGSRTLTPAGSSSCWTRWIIQPHPRARWICSSARAPRSA